MSYTCRFLIGVVIPAAVLLTKLCADDSSLYYSGEVRISPVSRFERLPTRLFLQPEFQPDPMEFYLPADYVSFFSRLLEGEFDEALKRDAARCIERVAREKLAAPESFRQAIRNCLKNSDSRIVTRTSALALLAVDDSSDAQLLAKVCVPNDEVLCAHIEPRLASWKTESHLAVWRSRLSNPEENTRHMTELACQCLGIYGDAESVDRLLLLARDSGAGFSIRRAAARACSILNIQKSFEAAMALSSGTTPDRILAVTFLEAAKTSEHQKLLGDLCEDGEPAVASLAWTNLQKLNPSRLVGLVESGKAHPDSNVRIAAIQVMEEFPSEQRSQWLNLLLADEHIHVRNRARTALNQIAINEKDLRPRILKSAGEIVTQKSSAWQELEQAMLLLGQQLHPEFQTEALQWLEHERNEVFVTSAWLLHLMPQEAVKEEAYRAMKRQCDFLFSEPKHGDGPRRMAISQQLALLYHVMAYTKQTKATKILSRMFLKTSPPEIPTRAVGMWALGKIYEGQNRSDLRQKFRERLFDDNPDDPEVELVKAGASLSMGLLGMTESLPDLELAHQKYGTTGHLGHCVSTAIRMLGSEPIPTAKIPPKKIGGWLVTPAK